MRALRTFVIGLTLLIGCQGGGGDGDGGLPEGWASGAGGTGGGSSVSEAQIADVIGLICDRARTCCMREGLDTSPLAMCEAELRQGETFAWFDGGRVRAVEPHFTRCLNTARSMVNNCALSNDPMAISDCRRAFEGTVAAGGACMSATECASGDEPVVCLRTNSSPDEEPGVCRPLSRGALGERCLTSATELLGGVNYSTFESEEMLAFRYCLDTDQLYCDFLSGTCTALLGEGASCTDSEACQRELYCDTMCLRRKPAGSPCTNTSECGPELLLCRDGTCSEATYADTEICEGDLD